ncbi:polycystic kidney disease 1-like 2 [Chamberlinius hualienensis]
MCSTATVQLILCILTIISWIVNGFAQSEENYVGCLEDNADSPVFVWSAGSFEPTMLNPSACSSACQNNQFSYGGIQEGRFCLCADEITDLQEVNASLCDSPCSANTTGSSGWCGGVNGVTSVYRAEGGVKFAGFSLTVSSSAISVHQAVTFFVELISGYNVQYRIDYDDGSSETIANASGVFTHKYQLPGVYHPIVHGSDDFNPQKRISQSLTISVVQQLSQVRLDCPLISDPMENFVCNVSMLTGTTATLTIDRGDDTPQLTYTVTETLYDPVGPPVPQVEVNDIQNSSQPLIVRLASTPMDVHSYIIAMETYVIQTGSLDMMVLQPHCSSGEFCYSSFRCDDPSCPLNQNQFSCLAPNVFHSSTRTCTGSIENYNDEMTFSLRSSTNVTLTSTGYFYEDFLTSGVVEMFPGDILSFQTKDGAIIAYANATDINSVDKVSDSIGGQWINTTYNYYFRAIVTKPTVTHLQQSYNNTANYTMTATITNSIEQPIINQTTIIIAEGIGDVILAVSEHTIATGTTVTLSATVINGSDFTIIWDFGDGQTANVNEPNSVQQNTYNISHTFSAGGTFTVTIIAYNFLDNETDSTNITVLNPVNKSDWTFESNSPQMLPPGTVNFTLSFTASQLPTEAFTDFIWDSLNPQLISTIQIPNGNLTNIMIMPVSHIYYAGGNYEAVAFIHNAVSNATLSTNVSIIERMDNLAATIRYQNGGSWKDAGGDDNNAVATNSNVSIEVTAATGIIERFLLYDANGQLLQNSSACPLFFQVSNAGTYNLTAYGWNSVQNLSEPIQISIDAATIVSGLEISDFYVTTDANETKTFELSTSSLTADDCVLVRFNDTNSTATNDLGEPIVFYAYGNLDTCYKNYTPYDIMYIGPAANPMNVSHVFQQKGFYSISVVIFNEISVSNSSLVFTVTDFPCPKPQIELHNAKTTIETALKYTMSEGILLKTEAIINCPVNITVTRQWQLYHVESHFGLEHEKIDLTTVLSSNKSFLYLNPLFLSYGFYKIVHVINIGADGMDSRFPWTRSLFTYIEIVPSPLQGIMLPGAMSNVLRGYGQSIQLDPQSNSVDPDAPNDKQFNISWFCRRVAPTTETLSVDADGQYQVTDIIQIPSVDAPKPATDNGGCFGTGVGQLDLTNGSWLLNTSILYSSSMTYEFTAVISKNDRQSLAKVELQIVQGNPPAVSIACQNRLICYPTSEGLLVNSNSRLGVRGHCIEGCDSPLHYYWTIYDSNNNDITEAIDYMVGFDADEMAINRGFFGNMTGQNKFNLQLNVTNSLGSVGRSIMFLLINQPPIGGSCSMNPPNGKVMLDIFSIGCNGWTDPEGHTINKYTFFLQKAESVETFILTSSNMNEEKMILPYGLFNVKVDIEDSYGAKTTVDIAQINLNLPSKEEYETYMNSSAISNIIGGGIQDKICQLFQAIASIKASGLLDPQIPYITNENGTNVTDAAAEAQMQINSANTMNNQLDVLFTITTSNTLQNLQMASGTLKSVVADGQNIDCDAKQKVVNLLDRWTSQMKNNIDVASPQDLRDQLTNLMSIISGITMAMANVTLGNTTLASDLAKVNEIDYDSSVDTDEDLETPLTMDGMHRYAIQADAQYHAQRQSAVVLDTFHTVGSILLSKLVENEELIEIEINNAAATYGRILAYNTSNMKFSMADSAFCLPKYCELINQEPCKDDFSVGIMAMLLPAPLQTFGRDIGQLSLNTKTIQIELYDENMQPINIKNSSKPIDIFIPRVFSNQTDDMPKAVKVNGSLKWNELMMYHQFVVDKPGSSINVEFTPDESQPNFLLFLRHLKKPSIDNFDMVIPLFEIPMKNESENVTFDWFIDGLQVNNRTGIFYLGVGQTTEDVQLLKNSEGQWTLDNLNLTYKNFSRNFTSNYSIRIFSSGCYFYNEKLNRWMSDGCWVSMSNYQMTHCKCTHLTSFGSGFVVAPNAVDFNYVFAHASFNDNLTIYMTIIITFVTCIVILIYARYKDRKDVKKLGAAPLPDNLTEDKYLYEILVFTGSQRNAGTDSKVFFILSGDDDESEVRHFADDQRKIFEKGGVDVFIMAVPKCLGPLNYMRVWHDNSGSSQQASWRLNYMVVRDVQTGHKFEFIANCWFALEEGDGCIDRLLPVAGREQKSDFGHLLSNTSQRELADGHLWFSIFLRPPRSRFTRVQRVGCCMAFLYLSMLVNAMWYGTVNSSSGHGAFKIGPLSISTEQIGVGLISNLIVFPPSFLIVLFFRKARPRKLRQSRIEQAIQRQKLKMKSESKLKLTSNDQLDIDRSEDADPETLLKLKAKYKRKRRCTLPWIFQVVAWILVVLCILASIFFLWSYGITFGNEKTKKWITSLIVSFFASVLITEPLKLFLMAMLFSAVCKSADMDSDDADEDEEEPELLADEQYLHNMSGRERRSRYIPPDPAALNEARRQRLKEVQMWSVLREILGYILFLWILVVVSYGNRDPNGYFFKRTLHRSFVRPGLDNDFERVNNTDKWWSWSQQVLIPRLRAQRLYNHNPPFGFKGFLFDQVNRMMGYAILRQIRIKPGICGVPEVMKNISGSDCSGSWTLMIDEDNQKYGVGWANNITNTTEEDYIGDLEKAFRYQSAAELDGYPAVGNLDVYSGGGYVVALKGRQSDLLQLMDQLQGLNWIDKYTRSVIVEFSVFNAQVNLFGVCTMTAEFVPGGGIFTSSRFDAIRLLEYHTGFGLVIMLCEILFVLCTLYFLFSELRQMCQQKKKWFSSYWNYAEILMILLSLAAIGVYVVRYIYTQRMIVRFNDTKGKVYVNLNYVYLIDQVFNNLLSLVVFVATLKFIKLLRFNRRMGVLSSTLAHAWSELAVFGLCFAIVFLAFVQLFYLIMATNSTDFSTFVKTVEYTFSMMLQKFDFSVIRDSCPFYGPVVFFVFSLMTSIVLVNLLLTIIIKAFEDVSRDIFKQPNDYEIVDFILSRFITFLGVSKKAPPASIYKPRMDSHGNDQHLQKLKERVDKLVNKVNYVYFNGKINFNQENSQLNKRIICS